jgi:hypothetical protein
MPDDLFSGLGPFQDGLTNERRGKLALRLTRACEAAPEARPAAQALGSLYDPAKREEALRLLNAMPSLPRRFVLSRYAHLSRLSRD